jgi:hypothetical protein
VGLRSCILAAALALTAACGGDSDPVTGPVLTGTVSYGGEEVDVYDGAPELDPFLEWGFARYEAAGLPLPRIVSVSFLRAGAPCAGHSGRWTTTDEGSTIALCVTARRICPDADCHGWAKVARHLWLHELAHAWLDQYAAEAVRVDFLDLVGLPRWSDHDDEWVVRGVERAANTIAYSVIDEPVHIGFDLFGDCAQRDQGFRILTGHDPITPCTDDLYGVH